MQINMQLQAGALLSFLSPGLPLCLAFLLLPAQWLRGGYVPEIVLLKEEVHLCCPEEWEMSQQRWVKLHPVRGTPLTFQEIYFEPHIRNQLENKEKTSNRRVLQKQIEFRITEQKRNPCEDSDHQLHILIWSISAHGKWQVASGSSWRTQLFGQSSLTKKQSKCAGWEITNGELRHRTVNNKDTLHLFISLNGPHPLQTLTLPIPWGMVTGYYYPVFSPRGTKRVKCVIPQAK